MSGTQPPSYNATTEYSSTAQSLAHSSSPTSPSPTRPAWTRSGSTNSDAAGVRWSRRRSGSRGPVPWHRRALGAGDKAWRNWTRVYYSLSLGQQIALSAFGIVSIVLTILALVYSEAVFGWLTPVADQWAEMPGGWVILWVATFFTAFPPMFGYSTCVTLAGFVFGMKGWWIIATANVVGSFCAFMLFRSLLSNFATKLAAKDPRFAAFGLVVAHDGLPILMLIRLTPLPYSLSNGGLSTVRTIKPWAFAVATAAATPKLLIHVFIGTRLKALAGGHLDRNTKMVNLASIAFGVILGAVTGVLIYRRTAARAKILQAEEARREAESGNGLLEHPDEFADDVDPEAVDVAEDVIDFIEGRYVDDEENQGHGPGAQKYADEESDAEGLMDEEDIRLTRTGKH